MTGSEWPDSLDVESLMAQGWRPSPFHEFVLKVHSRCNLSCDYCYVYTKTDQSWQDQPRFMSPPILMATADRIAEHAGRHMLPYVTITLHGGEPLLTGVPRMRDVLQTIQRTVSPFAEVRFNIQTNGVLLSSAFLDLFAEYGVTVGVSLDGNQEAHDRHRVRADGRGSHAEVVAGLDRLTRERRELFGGLLCAIDLANDPVETYEALAAFEPPGIDFLLPHGTWDAPPPGLDPDSDATPYADWLIRIFDHWFEADTPQPRIRLFSEIFRLLFGRASQSEAVGLSPVTVAVVETDGQIEQVDTLKIAYSGAARTGLHVFGHTFDEVLGLPRVVARQIGVNALSSECRSCAVHEICGGGLFPHRYRMGTGFLNPSIYCKDLFRVVRHISEAARPVLDRPRRFPAEVCL